MDMKHLNQFIERSAQILGITNHRLALRVKDHAVLGVESFVPHVVQQKKEVADAMQTRQA